MKKLLRSSILVLFVAATLASCKSSAPKEAKYIPKEAGFVMVLDPEQLQDKLQKGGISVDTLISRVFKTDAADAKHKAEFTGLKDSAGISWSNKFFLFMQQKTNADKSQSNSFSLIAGLQDSSKLEAYIKKQGHLKNKEVKKEKDYSYITLHDNVMLSWNDQQVIVTMYTHMQKGGYDTVAMEFKKPVDTASEAEMKTVVDHYYTQKVSESMADVSIFTDMFKEKADGYTFSNTNSSLGALSMMPLQIPKLEELVKDNYMTATLSFDDGKIVAKSTTYTNKLLSSVLQQYTGPTVDLSLIENYPSQNINGVMLAAFNPQIFSGILKQLEVEGLVNNFMEKVGFTSQDLYKSLKGDIAVVVSDINVPGDHTMAEQKFPMNHKPSHLMAEQKFPMDHKSSPLAKMIFNAPVGDKASFMKIMDKGVAQGFLVKKGNTYKAAASFMGIYFIADDKNLIIASDSLTYVAYMAKTTKAVISKDVLDKFKGKSTVFYFDIASTLNSFTKDSTGGYHHSLSSAKQAFKDVIATSDNFDGKTIKASFEIRMQNEKQNSLVTLTSLLTDIAVDMNVQAKRQREVEDKLYPGSVPAIIRTN